jgi:hypothetical protein
MWSAIWRPPRGDGLRFRDDWARKLIKAADAEGSAQATIPP